VRCCLAQLLYLCCWYCSSLRCELLSLMIVRWTVTERVVFRAMWWYVCSCELHDEKLSVYCWTCRACICHQCALWGGMVCKLLFTSSPFVPLFFLTYCIKHTFCAVSCIYPSALIYTVVMWRLMMSEVSAFGRSTPVTRSSRWMKFTRNTCRASMTRLLSSNVATSSLSASSRKWWVTCFMQHSLTHSLHSILF